MELVVQLTIDGRGPTLRDVIKDIPYCNQNYWPTSEQSIVSFYTWMQVKLKFSFIQLWMGTTNKLLYWQCLTWWPLLTNQSWPLLTQVLATPYPTNLAQQILVTFSPTNLFFPYPTNFGLTLPNKPVHPLPPKNLATPYPTNGSHPLPNKL